MPDTLDVDLRTMIDPLFRANAGLTLDMAKTVKLTYDSLLVPLPRPTKGQKSANSYIDYGHDGTVLFIKFTFGANNEEMRACVDERYLVEKAVECKQFLGAFFSRPIVGIAIFRDCEGKEKEIRL